jgi:hypothetical protein
MQGPSVIQEKWLIRNLSWRQPEGSVRAGKPTQQSSPAPGGIVAINVAVIGLLESHPAALTSGFQTAKESMVARMPFVSQPTLTFVTLVLRGKWNITTLADSGRNRKIRRQNRSRFIR